LGAGGPSPGRLLPLEVRRASVATFFTSAPAAAPAGAGGRWGRRGPGWGGGAGAAGGRGGVPAAVPRHPARLLRYLHALAGQDAEDIASETWLQVTRDLPGFSGTYDGFRGWVATIARHRALDHLRRLTRRPPALALPADLAAWPAAADTAQTALDAVATAGAVALIATLPPDQAEAVLLRAVLGLDAATAGQVLGKRPGAVRTAAHRGLKTPPEKTGERGGGGWRTRLENGVTRIHR
jgi:RNA polymerase sigma-70 factor, ECF subfamily